METKPQYFNCYSRKLMYFLGIYDVDFIDKYTNRENGRPYWVYERNENLTNLLSEWEVFKQTKKLRN